MDDNIFIPKDSGATREFSTGAHRDAATGKGRCDLLPLGAVARVFKRILWEGETIVTKHGQVLLDAEGKPRLVRSVRIPLAPHFCEGLTDNEKNEYSLIHEENAREVFTTSIAQFSVDHNLDHLADAIIAAKVGLKEYRDGTFEYMFMDVSKLYEAGALKYGANNWKKGMPVSVYLDSGYRHFCKARSDIQDEPHYRGPIWNLLCAMWTAEHIPDSLNELEPMD